MKDVTNVGVVGLGEQSWDNLLPSLSSLKEVNVQAVCDLDAEKSRLAARNYGATSYLQYMEMLDKEDVDAVIVASHPSVHSDVLKITIDRGIPTFVEKPPTLNTNELEELINLNKKKNVTTAVGLNFSYAEPVRFLKDVMRKEEFGNIEYLRVCHYGNKPSDKMWGLPNLAKSFLLSQAIHPLGLIYDIGNDIGDDPRINVYKNELGLLFNVNIQLADFFGNSFTVELLTCSTSPFFEWQLQAISSKGVIININSLLEIEVYSRKRESVFIDKQKWWKDVWQPSPLTGGYKRNGYEHQFVEFIQNIKNGSRNHTCIEEVLDIYKLMDKMEKVCEEQ